MLSMGRDGESLGLPTVQGTVEEGGLSYFSVECGTGWGFTTVQGTVGKGRTVGLQC